MRSIFVIGTDTGIGKTLICGLLGRYLLSRDCKVITQKWIQTGVRKSSQDIQTHLKLMKKKKRELKPYFGLACPYILKFASSPHLAAFVNRRHISADNIKKSFQALMKGFDFVIVEGIGGALVPFNTKQLVIDIVKDLRLPVLIVVGNKLGAINHSLLTIEALKQRGIKIAGVIFNNFSPKGNKLILRDNPKIVESISGQKILGTLPFIKNKDLLYKKFIPIAEKLCLPGIKKI